MEDIPKLCTAFAEWMSCMVIILIYKESILREKWKKFVLLSVVSAMGLAVIQIMCGRVSGILWLFGMGCAVLLMVIVICLGLEINWKTGGYLCARSFLLAEFLAALEWQVYSFYFGSNRRNQMLEILICILFFAVGYGFFYYIEYKTRKKRNDLYIPEVESRQLILVWMLTFFVFGFSNLSYVKISSPFSGIDASGIFNARTLIDLAGIFLLELFYTQ